MRIAVFRDGRFFANVFRLGWWAQTNGVQHFEDDRFVYPMIESGTYHICEATGGDANSTLRLESLQGRCASGYLAPGGTLDLTLPARSR